MNKKFHALTTKYNILYNGDLAFQQGKAALIETYNDNYWDVLPVERLQFSQDILLPGKAKDPNFERAEEKAVKAIQKHGMNIKGKEKNPQADEAYLLLGKSRYFDQRFIPALEAFNYILYKYPASDKINHAKIWREKVNIRLENTELAIKNLKRLIEQEELDKQDVSDAHAMLAQAYINNKHLDSALPHIKTAVVHTKNKEVRGRLGFIKGQLYSKLGYKDSANIAFDEIIALKRRTRWVYYINAQVAKARNFDFSKGDKIAYLEHLDKLIDNRENRPYLDKLYNLKAVYYQQQELDSLAIEHYNKSLRKGSTDVYLQSLNYRALAEYMFDEAKYKEAGAYYDSTLTKLKEKSKEYRFFKKKKDNLQDVIDYEDLAQHNDSILYVLSLSEADRVSYYQKHIKELKKQDSLKKVEEENKLLAQNLGSLASGSGQSSGNKPGFYFYNNTLVAYGKNEFRKIWGNRKLEDNWRRSNKEINQDFGSEEETVAVEDSTEVKDIYTPEFYITKLPTDPKVIDSITTKRNFTYYQLGLIYKQKFKEYPLSAKRLEKLLSYTPKERLALPAKYQLYKVYKEMNNSRSNRVKDEIIQQYPDSRYAEILRNPEAVLTADARSPEVIYKGLYQKFESKNYLELLESLNQYIPLFEGEPIVAKYELLKASTLGKVEGLSAYKKAINYVAFSYANTDEGKQAQEILKKTIPSLEALTITDQSTASKYKLVYIFDKQEEQQAIALSESIGTALKETYKDHLSVSIDFYSASQQLIVVHGFITAETAKNFHLFLDENKKRYKMASTYKIMSSNNYKTVQIHKKLNQIP